MGYYAGGFLLFFVPGLHLTRGGMAWMISSPWSSYTPQIYYVAVAAMDMASSAHARLCPWRTA